MMNKIPGTKILAATLLLLLPSVAAAQDALSGANTAWILTSTALVLFMTLPGLALFYGGLVRTRNVLSVLMQCFAIAVVVSILWLVVGYSIAFGPSESAYWGGLSRAMFSGVVVDSLAAPRRQPLVSARGGAAARRCPGARGCLEPIWTRRRR